MAEDDQDKTLGRKIAQHRQRRGLSQKEFARQVDRSETWLSQVERGVRRIDRMSVLEKLADALDLPLAELAADAPVVMAATQQPAAATELGLALSSSDALAAVLGEVSGPVDVERLAAQVSEAWTRTHASEYEHVGALLVRLLPELEQAARVAEGDAQREVFASLARAYHACAAVLSNVGDTGASWVAADRAIGAAERSGDALLMAEGAFRLTLVFQTARRLDQARQTASTAAAALERRIKSGEPEALSVWGALQLQLAVVAARQNRADEAEEHIRLARGAADRIGADRNDYNTEFGPTNVALHAVGVAVELGDAGRALRVAETIDASTLSPERQARFLIDVARAQAQRRNVAGVAAALTEVLDIAPELARSHPMIAELVGDLMRSTQGADPALRVLAHKLGLLS